MGVADASTEQTIDTDHSVLVLRPGAYVDVTAKCIDHTLAQAQDIMGVITDVRRREGRRVRVLVDMRAARSISREARLHYQSTEYVDAVRATALLVDSGISRVLGNFIVGLNNSPMITRLFTTEQDARAWLDSLADD